MNGEQGAAQSEFYPRSASTREPGSVRGEPEASQEGAGQPAAKPGAPVGQAIEITHTTIQMETPKGSNGVFELPCGYLDPVTQELITTVQVREITGKEEDMLASNQIPAVQKISLLLSGCVVRVGSEMRKDRISQIVQELMIGDRVFLTFAIRRVTLGDELPVRERCPACNVETLFMVDLATELRARPMKDPKKRIFDVVLPASGKQARFRVSTGSDEVKRAKLVRRAKNRKAKNRREVVPDELSQAIMMRLELLDGELPTLDQVQSLSMRDRNYLRQQFDEVEGGVDTTLELDCPACDHYWEKDLDLSTANFFSLGGRQRP